MYEAQIGGYGVGVIGLGVVEKDEGVNSQWNADIFGGDHFVVYTDAKLYCSIPILPQEKINIY